MNLFAILVEVNKLRSNIFNDLYAVYFFLKWEMDRLSGAMWSSWELQ